MARTKLFGGGTTSNTFRKTEIYDAFDNKESAYKSASDLRKQGYNAYVKKDSSAGRLKYIVYSNA